MALIPFATHKLIPAGSNDPPIIPIGIIWHVDAGNAYDLYDYFRYRSGGIESHGHIPLDGELFQYRNTGYEADANLKANSFYKDGKRYGYLSFETQGYGRGLWTPAQLRKMKMVMEWGHEEHGIPLRVCRNPQDPGIGYHTLFGAPSAWTPVAKSCPGPDRKKQFHNTIVPWLEAGGGQEDDMSWNEEFDAWHPGDKDPGDKMSAAQQLNQARGYAQEAFKEARSADKYARRANAKAGRIENALKALATGMEPAVRKAVEDALAEAVIDVDVNVNTGGEA